MDYSYLIGMLKRHETKYIRAFNGQKQTHPEPIPSAFGLLISDIVDILVKNFEDICGFDYQMVIFGLQPAGVMIVSNKPLETARYLDGLQPDYHFCCTLDFFKVPLNQSDNCDEWRSTNSIIIDFTSGEVMDSQRFLSKVYPQQSDMAEQGQLYGCIKEELLEIIWTIVKIRQEQNKNHRILLNKMVMMQEVA